SGSCVTSQEEVEGDGHVQTSLAFNVNGRVRPRVGGRLLPRQPPSLPHDEQGGDDGGNECNKRQQLAFQPWWWDVDQTASPPAL
nr:hypothetical protein [Myxococcales bacterium]